MCEIADSKENCPLSTFQVYGTIMRPTLSARTPPASPFLSPSFSPSWQWWSCSPCRQLRALSSSPRLLGRTIWNFQTDFQTWSFQIQSLTDFNFNNVDHQGKYCIIMQHGTRRTELVANMESLDPRGLQKGDLPVEPFLLPHFYTWAAAALALEFKSSFWIFHLHSRMHQNLTGAELHLLQLRGPSISTYTVNPRSNLNLSNGNHSQVRKYLNFLFLYPLTLWSQM